MIVAFSGAAGSGKDFAAKALRSLLEERGHTVEFMAFADKLKDSCCHLFDWDRDRLENDREYKESGLEDCPYCLALGKTRRQLLQEYGTEACRNGIDNEFWTKLMQVRLDKSETDYVLITDCRFPNEVNFVRKNLGAVMHVIGKETMTSSSSHASERSLDSYDSWDLVLDNSEMDGGASLRRQLSVYLQEKDAR